MGSTGDAGTLHVDSLDKSCQKLPTVYKYTTLRASSLHVYDLFAWHMVEHCITQMHVATAFLRWSTEPPPQVPKAQVYP